jgi:tetratricopeptide (TPR) repeat protein
VHGIGKIFISSRKSVDATKLDRIRESLCSKFGEKNIIVNIEIPMNQGFEEFLESKVGGAAVMVAVIENGWTPKDDFDSNDWMVAEMAAALGKKTSVVSILLDNMEFPSEDSLPASLKTLKEELSVSVNTESWNEGIKMLEVFVAKELALNLSKVQTDISGKGEMNPPPDDLSRSLEERHSGKELGLAGANMTDTRRAIEYYLEDLKFSEELNDRHGQALALSNLGLSYAKMNETRRSIEYFKRRLILIREIGTFEELAETLASLGDAHAIVGDLERAKKYFYEQAALAKEENDFQMEGLAFNGLGHVYIKLGEIEKGIDCYKKCLKASAQRQDLKKQGELLTAIGLNYVKLNRYKEAIIVQERAIEIYKELGNSHEEGLGLADLADSNAFIENFKAAISFGLQAIELFKEKYPDEVLRIQELIEDWGNK